MSCELQLQWKLILSVSLCSIFSGRQRGAERESRSPIKWDAKVPGARTGLGGPSGQSCNCQTSLLDTLLMQAEGEQDEKRCRRQQGNEESYLAKLQA